MSVIYPPAILGPEMAARQFYGRLPFFVVLSVGKPPCPKKIPRLGGRGVVFCRGGDGSANFIFMGVGILLTF